MFDLSLEMLRVVENAAVASARTMGMGDPNASDQAAVESMRRCLDTVAIEGTIVIGEGERDEAPMLYIGERVGAASNGGMMTVASAARRSNASTELPTAMLVSGGNCAKSFKSGSARSADSTNTV
jgi:hypothetical protein